MSDFAGQKFLAELMTAPSVASVEEIAVSKKGNGFHVPKDGFYWQEGERAMTREEVLLAEVETERHKSSAARYWVSPKAYIGCFQLMLNNVLNYHIVGYTEDKKTEGGKTEKYYRVVSTVNTPELVLFMGEFDRLAMVLR